MSMRSGSLDPLAEADTLFEELGADWDRALATGLKEGQATPGGENEG